MDERPAGGPAPDRNPDDVAPSDSVEPADPGSDAPHAAGAAPYAYVPPAKADAGRPPSDAPVSGTAGARASGDSDQQPEETGVVLPNWAWLLIGGLVGGILGAVLASSVNAYEPIAGSSYGDDAFLDKAYDLCQAGELSSCDLLWSYSEQGSEYESLAETCGGRRERNAEVFCIEDERVVGDAATDAGG